MMLSQKLQEALNAQVNAELWSANFYLAMALDAEHKEFRGIAHWFYVQYREELDHARIFMDYLNARDVKVELKAIEAVPTSWADVPAMFRDTLAHERTVTEAINSLALLAREENDFATVNRMGWFIEEQIEEEENVRALIHAADAVEGNKYGLFMLDQQLGQRAYSAPQGVSKE